MVKYKNYMFNKISTLIKEIDELAENLFEDKIGKEECYSEYKLIVKKLNKTFRAVTEQDKKYTVTEEDRIRRSENLKKYRQNRIK